MNIKLSEIIEALEDKSNSIQKNLFDMLQQLNTKIESINKRTKIHTLDIQKLEKEIKCMKSKTNKGK